MAAGDRFVLMAELTPYDPVGAAAVTVRACSVDDAQVTSLNDFAWWPVIANAPKRNLDLFDGEFAGKISAGIGDLELALAAFPNAARYSWGERPVTIWRGKLGDAWGSYVQIFSGLTRPPRASNGRLRIGLRVDDRWLDKPLLATYAGTGGAEGPADLKGTAKPLALGAPQFVEGIIVNRTLNIVQLHGYGAMNGVTAALDRLSRYAAAAGNDASYALLAAATIAPGAWRTCLAEGLVRFGAPPGGVLSFLAQGDSGSALGWVRTPGQVIRRIALIAGATTGQIDATSLAALDTAVPYNISLYLREQTTAREVIQSIAASCNAAAGVSWLGQLFVARAVIGSPAMTLAADGSALPPVASVEMLEQSAPFWRIGLEAERTERVHSGGEFGAIGAGDLAYADGTTVEALKPGEAGADVTADAVPVMALPAPPTIRADYTGAALSLQLPRDLQARRFRGGVDVTTSTGWSIVATGCSASIGGATGLITITAISATGKIVVTSLRDGLTIVDEFAVIKDVAPAPSTGGGGGGGGGGGSGSSASTSSIASISSASYGTVEAGPLTMTAGAAGTINLTAPLTFTSSTSNGCRGKWQWRIVGGSFADVASEVSSTSTAVAGEPDTGYIEVSQSKTGLITGTAYEFQLQLRRVSGTATMSFSGTAAAVNA